MSRTRVSRTAAVGGFLGVVMLGLALLTGLRVEAQSGIGRTYKGFVPMVASDSGGPPTATPTVAPVPPTPTQTAPAATYGTRANPFPIGTQVDLGDGWTVKVLSVTPNGTSAVLANNQFNKPPRPGEQFFLARLTASYSGSGKKRFDGDFRLRVLGSSSVTRTTFGNSCGVIPGDLGDPEVFAGGTISGNLCWSVLSSDVSSLLLYDKPFLGSQSGKFLSLVAPPGVVPPPPLAPAPAPSPGVVGRESPVPRGVTVPLAGSWNAVVVSSTPNATAQVLATNMFNKPPAPGNQFFIVRVRATYTGPEFDRFDGSFRLRAVGPSAVVKTTFNDSCGVIPDALPDPDVYPSGTIEGNLCWQIGSGDASGLVLFDHPFLEADSTFFMAVGP